MKKGVYINDSLHGLVSLSDYEKEIIAGVGFNRLHDIYQNSTAYLTFPSNRTKRFEHSIGTMKLCSDMFFASVLNASEGALEKFFGLFREGYEKIINGFSNDFCNTHLERKRPRELPYGLKLDKRHHSLLPYNVRPEDKVIHLMLIESIRVAALLHDAGHPPFSHTVERALKTVYEEYSKTDKAKLNGAQKRFLETMFPYVADGRQLHEEMGRKISEGILEEIVLSLPSSTDEDERLFYILVQEGVKRIYSETSPFSSLHRLIDSSLDGDRLDYVTRDPVNSGLSSGRIDYSRIINDMRLVVPEQGEGDDGEWDQFIFCVPLKSVNAVDDFVRRRYNVYKDIIYHHRVVKTDCLLEYTVRDLMREYLEHSPDESPSGDSAVIPFDISGLWAALREAPIIEKSYDLSQWNDAWLMTVLKKIYYEQYCDSKETGTEQLVMKARLSELLLYKKCYYSLIKRGEDFRLLDDAAKAVFYGARDELQKKMSESGGRTDWQRRLCDVVREFLELSDPKSQDKSFLMALIYNQYRLFNESKDFKGQFQPFGKYIEGIVKKVILKKSKSDIKDWIVCPKFLSDGLVHPIYFYGTDEPGQDTVNVMTLTTLSSLKGSLNLTSRYLPIFYIYFLMDGELSRERQRLLLQRIGRETGEAFKRRILHMLHGPDTSR